MVKEKRKSSLISHGLAAQNRKARFDYTIKETLEAGIVLKGPEVKSLRLGRATITEAWAGERDGELFLFNCYIPEYQGGILSKFEPRAPRKLLVKKKQRVALFNSIARDGHSVVPLSITFDDRGIASIRSDQQWSDRIEAVCRIHVSASLNQGTGDLQVLAVCRPMKRRHAVALCGIHV